VCFYGGVAALGIVMLLLVIHTQGEFHTAFNSESHRFYGTSGDAYTATLKAGNAHVAGLGSLAIGSTILLIPFLFFFNLWSNWGATLYGEVRGASDFKKNIQAMGGALLATSFVAVILLLLFAKTFGWQWYNAANNAYWNGNSPLGSAFPYPGLFAAFFFHSRALEFAVVALMSLWFFGWMGSIFLSSTRVVFASAFDRVLPEWTAKVSTSGVPYAALALMLIPSIPISYLYAYNSNFNTWTLDATLVIAITFLGSAIAAAILPWRKPDIYNASPIAKYKVLGIPLITASAFMFALILAFALYKWFEDDVYGVNNASSLWYMAVLYGIALAIYVISRIYRRTQGVDLGMVYKEIPSE
jgi:amino acid transporter